MSARAVLVLSGLMALWAFNFVAVKITLGAMPPFVAAALRFALAAFPALLFVPRPKLSLPMFIVYGLASGVMQIGFLYLALASGLGAGLGSLFVQGQVFFTAVLARGFLHERLTRRFWVALAIAVAGLALIGASSGGAITLVGLPLALLAGLGWGVSNVLARGLKAEPMGLVIWTALVSPLPFLGLALALDGPQAVAQGFAAIDLRIAACLGYTALINTVLGYGIWSRMIQRHGAAMIAPFGLLAPPLGAIFGWWFLGETLGAGQLAGGALIVTGVAVHVMRRAR